MDPGGCPSSGRPYIYSLRAIETEYYGATAARRFARQRRRNACEAWVRSHGRTSSRGEPEIRTAYVVIPVPSPDHTPTIVKDDWQEHGWQWQLPDIVTYTSVCENSRELQYVRQEELHQEFWGIESLGQKYVVSKTGCQTSSA